MNNTIDTTNLQAALAAFEKTDRYLYTALSFADYAEAADAARAVLADSGATQEAVDAATDALNAAEAALTVKPYTFRRFGAKDIMLMVKVIGAIGLKEFKSVFVDNDLGKALQSVNSLSDLSFMAGYVLDLMDVLIRNIPKCELELYQLLAQTSNMTVEEITAEGNAILFMEMLVDFFRKEDFKDFFKVVSRFL